jgi:hypothetical protein
MNCKAWCFKFYNNFNTALILLHALGGLVVACLPLDPRFAGSNPAEDDGFLRVIKIRSTISTKFSRRSHVVDLRHVKGPYKHERDVL